MTNLVESTEAHLELEELAEDLLTRELPDSDERQRAINWALLLDALMAFLQTCRAGRLERMKLRYERRLGRLPEHRRERYSQRYAARLSRQLQRRDVDGGRVNETEASALASVYLDSTDADIERLARIQERL